MRTLTECPVCASVRIRHSFGGRTTRGIDAQHWEVFSCQDCTHEFMNPLPSWEELAPYYSATYAAYDRSHGATQTDGEIVADASRTGTFRHIPVRPGAQLLDVGCGGGFFLRIMSQLGVRVMGVEPSENGVAAVRQDGLPVFHGTLEEFLVSEDARGRKFDVITSSHVLEHVPNPVETLTGMRQLLAPDGYIWIAVPNANCVFARHLGARWHSRDLPYHVQQFTPRSLAEAGTRAGLRAGSITTYSLPGAVAMSLRQYLRYRCAVPNFISTRVGLIDSMLAPWVASRLDRRTVGEAILATFVGVAETK